MVALEIVFIGRREYTTCAHSVAQPPTRRVPKADHAPCMHARARGRRPSPHTHIIYTRTLVRARVRFRRRRVIIKSGDGRVLLLRVRHPFLRDSIPAAVDGDTSHAHAGRSSVLHEGTRAPRTHRISSVPTSRYDILLLIKYYRYACTHRTAPNFTATGTLRTRARALSHAHSHTPHEHTARRGIMPNGQIAGCDAVVERTAVAAFTANCHRRRGGITLHITVSGGGVCGSSPPARVAGHFTGGVSIIRCRLRQHEQRQWKRWWPWTVLPLRWRCRNYAQEHRTHAVAARQTGTCRLKYDIMI